METPEQPPSTQVSSGKLLITKNLTIAQDELRFRTSRSGGPGGQNVNKLETRVELLFDITHSPSLSEGQRERLFSNLKSNVDAHGVLSVVSQKSRSQWKNKQEAIEKFARLIQLALRTQKKRVKTSPTLVSKEKRIQEKIRTGEKKKMRKVDLPNE